MVVRLYARHLDVHMPNQHYPRAEWLPRFSDYLKDNARPEAGEIYRAMDMGWAKLVGQIAQAYGSKRRLTAEKNGTRPVLYPLARWLKPHAPGDFDLLYVHPRVSRRGSIGNTSYRQEHEV